MVLGPSGARGLVRTLLLRMRAAHKLLWAGCENGVLIVQRRKAHFGVIYFLWIGRRGRSHAIRFGPGGGGGVGVGVGDCATLGETDTTGYVACTIICVYLAPRDLEGAPRAPRCGMGNGRLRLAPFSVGGDGSWS